MNGTTAPADLARDLVEAWYRAFNAADWGAMLALLADDVVHDINQGGCEVGRAAFEAFLARMARCYDERIDELVVLTEPAGRRAAAEYCVVGRYRATDTGLPEARGQTYALRGGAFFEVAEGRIARVTNWYDLQDWLRQIA